MVFDPIERRFYCDLVPSSLSLNSFIRKVFVSPLSALPSLVDHASWEAQRHVPPLTALSGSPIADKTECSFCKGRLTL